MAESPPSDGAPTTKQTLIVALAMGVVAGGGGGGLGYILGGQVMSNPGETMIEPSGSKNIPSDKTASANTADTPVDHGGVENSDKKAHEVSAVETQPKHTDGHSQPQSHIVSSKLTVRELTPIVTNLAEPATNWIRLQSAIVFDPDELPHPEKVIAELTSDITGYLRTIPLTSLEGADGLRRLQEELSERATIRSHGKIHEFIVETMVVQ